MQPVTAATADTRLPDVELALRVAAGDDDAFRLIMRLVKGGPERRAIEAGQVDAVMDPATGKAFLLLEAQVALRNCPPGSYASSSTSQSRGCASAAAAPRSSGSTARQNRTANPKRRA